MHETKQLMPFSSVRPGMLQQGAYPDGELVSKGAAGGALTRGRQLLGSHQAPERLVTEGPIALLQGPLVGGSGGEGLWGGNGTAVGAPQGIPQSPCEGSHGGVHQGAPLSSLLQLAESIREASRSRHAICTHVSEHTCGTALRTPAKNKIECLGCVPRSQPRMQGRQNQCMPRLQPRVQRREHQCRYAA